MIHDKNVNNIKLNKSLFKEHTSPKISNKITLPLINSNTKTGNTEILDNIRNKKDVKSSKNNGIFKLNSSNIPLTTKLTSFKSFDNPFLSPKLKIKSTSNLKQSCFLVSPKEKKNLQSNKQDMYFLNKDSSNKLLYLKNEENNETTSDRQLSVVHQKNSLCKFESEQKTIHLKNCVSISEYSILEQPNSQFRTYMEDYSKAIDKFADNKSLSFFIICDGHGGSETSSFVINKLPELFESEIRKIGILKSNHLIEKAYIEAFDKCDKAVNTFQWSIYSGTTCSSIFIMRFINKISLVTANIGDSSVIYINPKKDISKILTIDDKVSNADEIERIKSLGGFISNGRLCGQLAISRSFGDSNLKGGGLISVPHVCNFDISVEDINDSYVILASDGIWDEISSKDLLEYSKEVNNFDSSSKVLGERILKEAIKKGSTDNISVIVVKL